MIPKLKSAGTEFDLLLLPPLFSDKSRLLVDFLEVTFMVLGLENLRPSYFQILRRARKFSHVVFNNFIPTISLRVPVRLRKRGIRTVAWVHNSRAICANGLNFNGQTICDRCITMGSWWAYKQRCYPSKLQSFIYALTYRWKRVPRLLSWGIDYWACVSDFTLRTLQEGFEQAGLASPRGGVFREGLSLILKESDKKSPPKRIQKLVSKIPAPFFLYLGRISFEKGADLFAEMAEKHPEFGFLMAGEGPMAERLKKSKVPNLVLTGVVNDKEKSFLFEKAAALVIPSRVRENAPMVLYESQPFKTPVVYPRDGGAEELVKWLGRKGWALNEFEENLGTGNLFSKGADFSRAKSPSPSSFTQMLDLI